MSEILDNHITINIATWFFNSLDYYLWDAVDGETNKTSYKTKELKARVTAAFNDSIKETIKRACKRILSGLKAVFEASSDI